MWLGSANVQEHLYTKAHMVPEVYLWPMDQLGPSPDSLGTWVYPSSTTKSRNPERLVSLPTAEANSALFGVCVQKLSSKEIDTLKRQPTAVWSQHRGFGWGILSCRSGYPPGPHYSAADAWPSSGPSHLGGKCGGGKWEAFHYLSLMIWDLDSSVLLLALSGVTTTCLRSITKEMSQSWGDSSTPRP